MKPRALVLHASGTNRDLEAAQAFELAGALPEILPLTELRRAGTRWAAYQVLVIPGGFSYADALGAGKLLALALQTYFADEVLAFVESGKPVVGICNGFQALVKASILPAAQRTNGHLSTSGVGPQSATLMFNASGRFECRWVTLRPQSHICVWTRGLTDTIECPVAHGEGKFVPADSSLIAELQANDQIALVYARSDGSPSDGEYPHNPNGSAADIAGVCNPPGNVLGLMPHPEDHVFRYQHPRWARGARGGLGLSLFEKGVRYAAGL